MLSSESDKDNFLSKTLKKLNTFKTGFITGLIFSAIVLAGASHAVFNVFRFGQVTFGPNAMGEVGSPKTETTQTTLKDSANSQINNPAVQGDGNLVAQNDSQLDHKESNNKFGDISAGGDVNVTISYKDNSELPGFDAGKGYLSKPPNIGQFNDAILVSNVSFGHNYFKSQTQDVFIQGKKYKSTFHLTANQYEPTRVAFSLKNSPSPKGIFFQFGLSDWTSGTTTLTYLVKISADGELLWSGQVKYAEKQIASVILNNKGYSDIFFEYQIVEAGNAQPYQNPLFFTDAKLLLK